MFVTKWGKTVTNIGIMCNAPTYLQNRPTSNISKKITLTSIIMAKDQLQQYANTFGSKNTGLFISPSGIFELD